MCKYLEVDADILHSEGPRLLVSYCSAFLTVPLHGLYDSIRPKLRSVGKRKEKEKGQKNGRSAFHGGPASLQAVAK